MHVAIIYNFKSHESITRDVCETLAYFPSIGDLCEENEW